MAAAGTAKNWQVDIQPHGGRFAVSDHGGMTRPLFNDYLRHHVGPWMMKHGEEGSKIIIIDGDLSREPDLQTIKWLMDNDIHLFRLPAHTTHLLCPLDVSVFGKLKSHYSRILLRETQGGKVNIDVATRRHLMDRALSMIAPGTVQDGWKHSGLYLFDENRWKEEKWAETSVPFALPRKPPAQPQPRCSPEELFDALKELVQNDALAPDEILDRTRQLVRSNPSDEEVVQAALPHPQIEPEHRRRGAMPHTQAVWLTTDEYKEIARAREEQAAQEQEETQRKISAKAAVALIKEIRQAAEAAHARAVAVDLPAESDSSARIHDAEAAKHIALQVVKLQEEHGVGKGHAAKARKLAADSDRQIAVLRARAGNTRHDSPPAAVTGLSVVVPGDDTAKEKENNPDEDVQGSSPVRKRSHGHDDWAATMLARAPFAERREPFGQSEVETGPQNVATTPTLHSLSASGQPHAPGGRSQAGAVSRGSSARARHAADHVPGDQIT